MRKAGNSMKKVSKNAPAIYKGARDAINAGGQAWKAVDAKSYDQYGRPAGNAMWEAKEMGKSAGGWKAFGEYGDMAKEAGQAWNAPAQPQLALMLI